jgi:hypothetical protein
VISLRLEDTETDTFNEITCQSSSQIEILATELENTNKIHHSPCGFIDNQTEIVTACLNITSEGNQNYTHEQRRKARHECEEAHASHARCLCRARRSAAACKPLFGS